ncbi:MAG: VWA domain-containing protein [Lachnospiraceae bacterium]|nr:VWA domain-containing protein [Lachnospiraceae bacterium]
MKSKSTPIIGLVIVCIVVFAGFFITRNIGKSTKEISRESAEAKLEKMVKEIAPLEGTPTKSAVEYTDSQNDGSELPEIDDESLVVRPSTSLYAEIFSSPEKAGSGSDGWLTEMAEKFNREGYEVNGQDVSIMLRNITSGLAMDYIRTGKYVPDGFTPSSIMWINMLNSYGVETDMIDERMVGNTAVLVFKNDTYKDFISKYGSMDLKSVVEATEAGDFIMGYTNPFTSSTGLNFLISTLERHDDTDPLSATAEEGFKRFQQNIPFVAMNTVQMRDAADKGTLDGFVLETQLYNNEKSLSRSYTATPFGYRHDNPLVAISSASDEKKEILRLFSQMCEEKEAQDKAAEYGFNTLDDYKNERQDPDGETLREAQKLYKSVKDAGKEVIGVFVADVSGSMDGTPLYNLQKSLINSIQYISPSNYIGLVSYANDVVIEVPIGEFGLEQQALFKGGVEGLYANGGTATYDAVCVAVKMVEDALAEHPDAKPIVFVLSDGETNSGYSLSDIQSVVKTLKVPIYTINYNDGDSDALKALSGINEAASINSDSDDVVYQLKNLLNASM